MARRLWVTGAVLGPAFALLAVVALAAQQPAPALPPGAPTMPGEPTRTPARGARPAEDPQKGTAVLRGYVTAADTGDPLRRALVRATVPDGRGGSMVTTDADGRFEMRDLPGGRYTVTASKAGYVAWSYGQRRPEQPGTVLDVPDGAMVEKLAFSLPRGGVITGTVLDEFGDPVAGAMVTALRSRYMSGSRRLTPSGMAAQTDDRGVYRIYGLAPADYYVSATLRPAQQMMALPGVSAGGPVDGHAPTYYPGTPNVGEAGRVTVRAAQETTSISLALVAARLARVTGRAVNSSGAPVAQAFVTAMPVDRATSGFMTASTMTGPDGAFQLLGLAPGTYMLTLRPRGGPTSGTEFASVRVTVGDADLENVVLATARGAMARGVVTTDEGGVPPLKPEQVNLFAQPTNPGPIPMMGEAKVHPDWTFEMSDLSEHRLLRGNVAQAPDWSVKAIFHNDIDVTDTPFEFVPGQTLDGFTVVLTRKQSAIAGQITGERNAPDTDATVIAFSQNQERWTFGSRYLRTARPDQDGRYTLRGLPPHDYLLVAVKDLEPGQFQDPEFLNSVRDRAVQVTVQEGASAVQDLKSWRP